MGILYATENLITADTPLYASTEDTIYTLENLYNERPSKPFRFLGDRQSPREVPEWVCVDLTEAQEVTLCAIFNHNFGGAYSAADFRLKSCDSPCSGSGACNWSSLPSGSCNEGLLPRLVSNHRNIYKIVSCYARYFRVEINEANNPIPQIGELFLGRYSSFSRNVHLQDGRPESPAYYMGNQETHFGQDWTSHRSTVEWESSLVFDNLEDPAVVSEMQGFLNSVQESGGRFIIIPDGDYKFCYYVVVKNYRQLAENIVYGQKRLKRWSLDLKALVEGVEIL